jgi:prephenate dehydratase
MLSDSQLAEAEIEMPRVAIQGVHGAFHEIAARHYYQSRPIEIVPAEDFPDVVRMVETKETTSGLMAIENTIAGSLLKNYNLLYNNDLQITGEVYLRIKQNLMALPGQSLADLKEVHSHPIALQQCLQFFEQYPHIKLVEATDTALVAQEIAKKKQKKIGAIGSYLAADLYNLNILAESIETYKQNYTRFLVLNNLPNADSAPFDKVSICFSAEHRVGSLHQILGGLAQANANLTKIQSVPLPDTRWEYLFFIDFQIFTQADYENAMKSIKPFTNGLRVLGKYITGVHFE